MNENIEIKMKVLSCLHSREQPFILQSNLLSFLLGVKAKKEQKYYFLISMNLININGDTFCKGISFKESKSVDVTWIL